MAKVTIGRRLYVFFAYASIAESFGQRLIDPQQPCDAGVIYVHPDNTMNLQVTDHYGNVRTYQNVKLLDQGAVKPTYGHWAEWMPYQVKAEAERAAKFDPESGD